MSGRGGIEHRRPLRDTVEAERADAVAHVRGKIAFLKDGALRHRLSADQQADRILILDELADELDRGLHRRDGE